MILDGLHADIRLRAGATLPEALEAFVVEPSTPMHDFAGAPGANWQATVRLRAIGETDEATMVEALTQLEQAGHAVVYLPYPLSVED